MSFVEYSGDKININNYVLHLSNKEIKDIDEIKNLNNLTDLKELYLNGNRISEIKGLEKLTNLEVLDLSENQISKIKGLDSLKSLTFLDLYSNPITEIEGLDNLAKLEEFYIGKCRISNLKGLNNLVNLKILDVESTNITGIKNLNNLTNLETLFLGFNQIKEITGLDALTKLRQLELEGNKISYVKGLDNLRNLEFLNLFNNQISEIDGLDRLQNLKEFSLDENKIKEIKKLEKCENLESLWIDRNEISEIENLENLTNLENLGLSENKINEIKGLEKLTKLKILLLYGNKIQDIKGLENLINLEELALENNKTKRIQGLNKLEKLRHLSLNNNQINELEGLEGLENLENLDLYNNQFKGIDEYIIRSGTSIEGIRNYCKRKKSRRLPQYEFYDENKSYDENIQKFANILNEFDEQDFIKIGTFEEDKSIKRMQNLFFYDKEPEIIKLSEKNLKLQKNDIHLIQIHSLKGITYPEKNKIEFFKFFLSQFWDKTEIINNGCLIYKYFEPRVSQKIEEMIELSNTIRKKRPNLIIFPENTIPYKKIPFLVEFSKRNDLIIVGGLEHSKLEESEYFINKAIIIDNGNYDFQVKQTPVQIISRKLDNPIQEKIKCEKLPKFKIFKTSLGRIAIFICRDFLRLNKIVSQWATRNEIDFIIIPSLTSKVLPFHSRLLDIFNQRVYSNLKIIFTNIGEYGGSEVFSINDKKRIEENFRINLRDNVGETIIVREIGKEIQEKLYSLFGKFFNNWAKFEKLLRYIIKVKNLDREIRHYSISHLLKLLYEKEILYGFDYPRLNALREFKNRVGHGDLTPSEIDLRRYNQFLESIIKKLQDRFNIEI